MRHDWAATQSSATPLGGPFSRATISTERREGGMLATAVTQSSPAFFTFLYSTRNDWMGKPRLPRGIHVTYAEVSVAVEMVGLSGASGAVGAGGH